MKQVEIFDPAMCCPTGICGPSIDPVLLRIATLLISLKRNGIEVKRHGLASEPQDFVANKAVSAILRSEGADVLPVTLVDGEIKVRGRYPSNEEFSAWLDININEKSRVVPASKTAGGV